MNLLIVGGLLAVGVLAIVGAVLLSLNEQKAETMRRNQEPLPALPTNRNQTVKLRPADADEPATGFPGRAYGGVHRRDHE